MVFWREYYPSKNISTRCSFVELHLHEEEITFKEFKLLTSYGLKVLSSRESTIYYGTGTVVPIEVIFQHLKKIKGVY